MAINVYKYVLGLKVSVKNALVVDVLQPNEYLGEVEPCLHLREASLSLKKIKELTARTEVHYKM
jgi:hypothetical protein